LIAPYYIFFLIFVLLPILINLGLSFTNYNLRTMKFVGVDNYAFLFKDARFQKSLINTIVYTVFTLGFSMAQTMH